jgi:hypothetical protein
MNISPHEHRDRGTSVIFLGHVAPRNIRAYVPRGTKEHNRTYVPRSRGTEERKFDFLKIKNDLAQI